MTEEPLLMYVLYDRTTKDYPNEYVLRIHEIRADRAVATSKAWFASTPEPLRQFARERGLVRINRYPTDDPVILESWI